MQLLTKEILDSRFEHYVDVVDGGRRKEVLPNFWVIDYSRYIHKSNKSDLYELCVESMDDELEFMKIKYVEELDTVLEIMKRYENE